MPIFIANRGNLEGPQPEYENRPEYILGGLTARPDLHCEIDVWFIRGEWFLGHTTPDYKVHESFLVNARLWCHAKNLPALEGMLKNPLIHCFWHQEDDFTITSRGFIWTYPNHPLTAKSICVMPELYTQPPPLDFCAGVCSDYMPEISRCE